jgi:beta-lactamase class A
MSLTLNRMGDHRQVSAGLLPAIVVVAVLTLGAGSVQAKLRVVTPSDLATSSTTDAISAQAGAPSTDIPAADVQAVGFPVLVVPRDLSALAAGVQQVIASSGASVGVTVVELGGTDPAVWSVNAAQVFTAASTYKLAALMLEAANIAAGKTDPNGLVCFQDDDYESGWFDDYADGACFTRNELALRAGTYSDNTAGHMLVRDVGGAEALDAWAASVGATNSAFYVSNTTTSADLAALWTAEVDGNLGGAAAQAWLYPLLTNTRTESGVPAGVAGGTVVVHKTGTIDLVDNDAALVTSGPAGAYILVVMTDGLGGPEGWQLIAQISATVWQFEASRAQ